MDLFHDSTLAYDYFDYLKVTHPATYSYTWNIFCDDDVVLSSTQLNAQNVS